MEYEDDDMLMLSGIQHYVFCPRQWALIHMDNQWVENSLTVEGSFLHKNVDNPNYRIKSNGRITLRSIHLSSKKLGLYGIADAVELISTEDSNLGISHPRYPGYYIPYPIEYKRGHHKTTNCDIMQLVAQVMCLEEMFGILIPRAALFYWEERGREEIIISENLRNEVYEISMEMHKIIKTGVLPLSSRLTHCKKCSLMDICLPELQDLQPVSNYLQSKLYEETS